MEVENPDGVDVNDVIAADGFKILTGEELYEL
jgi:hypothetical protein